MTDQSLNALRISIGKWVGIRDGEVEDAGGDNCALCSVYATMEAYLKNRGCSGCPVKMDTGSRGCFGTPYHDGPGDEVAIAMIAYLKSLLPEGDPLK